MSVSHGHLASVQFCIYSSSALYIVTIHYYGHSTISVNFL
jgi:hypothetical protein